MLDLEALPLRFGDAGFIAVIRHCARNESEAGSVTVNASSILMDHDGPRGDASGKQQR
jgi:hypothetical protein